MNRVHAALVHLSASIVIGVVLLALFWFVWYPDPLFRTSGALPIFLTLVGVDVAIGPLLTLVVFKQGKRSLYFDVAVIVALQAAAMTYGAVTLYAGRPVYVAGLGHRFDVIHANEVADSDLARSGTELPKWGPLWVGTRVAADAAERERVLSSSLSGVDYGHMPQHHVPLTEMREELRKRAEPIADLRVRNPQQQGDINAWLSRRQLDERNVLFLGLKDRAEDMAVIIDAKTAEVIGIAPFKPWD